MILWEMEETAMMDYSAFKEEIVKDIVNELGAEPDIDFCEIYCLNHNGTEGLVITDVEKRIRPVFPIELFYNFYLAGKINLEEIKELAKIRLSEEAKDLTSIMENILEKEIQENIFLRLINYEKNKDWLQKLPHRKFLNLAVVYYIERENVSSYDYIVNINNALFRELQMTEEELYQLALRNSMQKKKAEIQRIQDMMPKCLWCLFGITEEPEVPMYVLTNENKKYGASCLLYENVLKELAEQVEDDLYILPSSIQEVVVIPKSFVSDMERLKELVKEVNQDMVQEEEVLGDSVYCYDRENNSMLICC